jgi:terminal uridylyltransferase
MIAPSLLAMAYSQPSESADSAPHRRVPSRHRFVADLSQCLFDFVIQLLPTQEEMAVKEDVRKLLERLVRTLEPDSRLLSFGSTANGFSLRNSDMDLCCLLDAKDPCSATDLVTMLGDLLERGSCSAAGSSPRYVDQSGVQRLNFMSSRYHTRAFPS